MKATAGITPTHNPSDETHWASGLRENLTSRSYGEGLETGRATTQAPRQSLTRQEFFNANQALGWKRAGTQNLHIRYAQMTMALI
ncbi:MAG TPA: hypothetical protein VHM88_17745, partial [Candidatus Acidoferrales bacterium]|nr:hypothetical protein [Candidatus Acidoferrales bacterium]